MWLHDNGYEQYAKSIDVCKGVKKGSKKWQDLSCEIYPEGRILLVNNLDINTYKGRWSIPFKANPNKDTLIYYLYKYLYSHDTGDSNTIQWGRYEVQPSNNPYEFKSDLREEKFVKKEMRNKKLLSYLLFEDDKIVIDEISPKDVLGEFVNNDTKFRSNSMGKSLVAYVAGHAICAGYIDSIESKIDDWPLLKGTLYEGQKLIDILNMKAGDQKYVYDSMFWDGTEADTQLFASNMYKMQGKKKSKPKYNYNVLLTNLIFNYVQFKSGDDFENLLNDIFQNTVRIKDSVYFFRASKPGSDYTQEFGDANSMFYSTKYDYLRIGKAIVDDWQNDTCVGKYLKTIYKNRIKKGNVDEPSKQATKSYGGQFHMDVSGLKDRKMFVMGGYGGQAIMIDVEESIIVVLNSMHYNHDSYKYSHKKLLVKPFKKK
ncbi:hypothetical protein OAP47_02690 [Candidatus Pelagibacter sp.]|nr:hypothetical protein [Candidatus Pelagibacter sp.]